MNTIRNFIRVVAILFFTLFPIYVIFMIPKYPIINSSLSIEKTTQMIMSNLDDNSRKYALENMYKQKKLLSYKKEFALLEQKIMKCKDKACLIEEYNNFMSNWVSEDLQTISKAIYISNKFGLIGNLINKNCYWLYSI